MMDQWGPKYVGVHVYQKLILILMILRRVIPVVCWKNNGELISVRKHNYNCMLNDGIY